MKIPDHAYTHHELTYTVTGHTAKDIDERARNIAEQYFGVPVELQVTVTLNPVAAERQQGFYRGQVTAREKK